MEKGKFQEVDDKAWKGTSSQGKIFDSACMGASGSSHVQTENLGYLGKVAEMARQVLGNIGRTSEAKKEIDQKKQKMVNIRGVIKYNIECIPAYKQRMHNVREIYEQIDKILARNSIHKYLCWYSTLRDVENIRLYKVKDLLKTCTSKFEVLTSCGEEYSEITKQLDSDKNNPHVDLATLDVDLATLEQFDTKLCQACREVSDPLYNLETDSWMHKKTLQTVCSSIQRELKERYKIEIPKEDVVDGLEKHIYQNLSEIVKISETRIRGVEHHKYILSGILKAGLKATGEPTEQKANEKIAEKLFAMLEDKQNFSEENHKVILTMLAYVGHEKKHVAQMIAKRFTEMFYNQSSDKEEENICQYLPEAFGALVKERRWEDGTVLVEANEYLAINLVEPLLKIFYDKNITIERREFALDAINYIVYRLQDNENVKLDIIGRVNAWSHDHVLENEFKERLEVFMNRWDTGRAR